MWQILLFLFGPPLLFIVGGAARETLTPWALVNVLGWPAILLVSVALHEGGHALAARLVGLQVPRITVGIGRELWRKRFGGTLLVLNAFPLGGLTSVGSAGFAWLRLRIWITVAAGPLMTAALAWAAFTALSEHPMRLSIVRSMPAEPALLHITAFLNLVLLIANLIPFSTKSTRGMIKDGQALLTLPGFSRERLGSFLDAPVLMEVAERFEVYDDLGADALLETALRDRPDSWYLQLMRACVESELGRKTEARAACQDLLQRLPDESMEPIARGSLAAVDCSLRSPDLHDEADAHSAFALEKAPDQPWALGVRGHVLVWLGRPEEGIPLLEKAYLRSGIKRVRACDACGLVVAHATRGELGPARRWLDRAVENGGRGKRLEEAQAALKEAEERKPAQPSPSS